MKTNQPNHSKRNVLALVVASASLAVAGMQAASTVRFDNQSGKPALVKLVGPTTSSVSVDNGKKESVSVTPGHYFIKVRYGTPGDSSYSKGDEFDATETTTTTSDITITLHKVVAGNYGSKSISEAEFGREDQSGGSAAVAADTAGVKEFRRDFQSGVLPQAALSDRVAEVSITGEGTNMVVKFSVKSLPKLAEGEALQLVVFFSRTNGPALDEHIVSPDGVRVRRSNNFRGLLFDATKFSSLVAWNEIMAVGAQGFERGGYAFEGGTHEEGGTTWEMPVGLGIAKANESAKSLGRSPSGEFDSDWFAGQATVSAAVFVFKERADRKKGDPSTEFVRFVSPVTCKRIEFKK